MIAYFSGTGNSRYAAQRLAALLSDSLLSINEKLKSNDSQSLNVSGNLVIVVPTYAWRIPRVVQHWMENTKFQNIGGVWFVMTCGSEIGSAAKYNRALCARKRLRYMGTAQLVMPENYVAMFDVPTMGEAKRIIAKAEPDIDRAGKAIGAGQEFPQPSEKLYDRFMSAVVNPLFYRFAVRTAPFRSGSTCVSCGKCAQLCPLNNIRLMDGKPSWGRSCTHCMACICHCPTAAIEYGKKSRGKTRYHCD